MASRKRDADQGVRGTFGRVGTCRVYSSEGEVLWEREGFEVGRDRVPRRLSLVMAAMQVVDPGSGDRVARWDPRRMLGG